MLTTDDLLQSPRGRGLCIAVARRLYGEDWPAWYGDHLGRSDVVVQALDNVDPTPVRDWRDPLSFAEDMEFTVGNAMYWQEPPEDDAVAADPDVTAALRPVAAAVVTAPAAAWWDHAVDLAALRYTSRYDADEEPSAPAITGARRRLAGWRTDTINEERRADQELPSDATAPVSGRWWSTPTTANLVTTTRSLPGLGSIQLAWEEDSFGQDRAAIWPLLATRAPRVWEIDRPQAWIRLVDEYPLEVTYSRRHDWYRTTGWVATWRVPDWTAVAADWDAVHLSVAGYLTTATRAHSLADGAGTVLAGWDPDQTWWLNDVLAPSGPGPESWRRSDHPDAPALGWRRTS